MAAPEPLSFIEQALVRSAGSWWLPRMVAGAAEDAISAAKRTQGGGSTTLKGRDGWRQITAKGIGWSDRLHGHSSKPSEFEVFVSWVRLKAHVQLVTTEALVEDARAYEKRNQKHNLEQHEHSCPNKDMDPEGNAAFHQWFDGSSLPEFRTLRAQYKNLLDRILPALIDWAEESESLPSD